VARRTVAAQLIGLPIAISGLCLPKTSSMALGPPVGMSFAFNFLLLKLPTREMTLSGTYSWLLGPHGCKCE